MQIGHQTKVLSHIPNGTHICELEIDKFSGLVKIIKLYCSG